MDAKEVVGLLEAYQQVYEQQTGHGPRLDTYHHYDMMDAEVKASDIPNRKIRGSKRKGVIRKEEVEIAAQYFYEMGLNEDGVDILIEDLGEEEFADFVYEIVEEYNLTEETRLQAKGALKGPKGSKPQSTTKAREKAQGGTKMKADASPASTISPKRIAAAKKAKENQPKKRPVLDAIARQVTKGMERHKAAMSAARETGKTISKAAKGAGKVAREVGKGVSGVAKLAGHLASKGLKEEQILEYLMTEGYAETAESAKVIMNNMSEQWIEIVAEGMTMKDFKQQRSRQKQKEKRAAEKTSPTRRANMSSYERAVRHRVSVDPDYDRDHEERDYPGGVTKNPKKIRKAKALGEIG